ncbi:hypothetical protein PDE_09682 [Penicillium oxalicum 114-2]|uniref:Uncharacterized protein n=1 Tax=Penicillium oxalicum (strain 114-2 / CGMCC 5302) TaxID=933388 RepID=S8B721_PENO1|nr:hypothetical protein PDE_09682 [Penicillium oxalicum 114-2]
MHSSQNDKTKRSKRADALKAQQTLNLLRQIPRLEIQQSLDNQAAQCDAANILANKLKWQNDDLIARLDEAEMVIAKTETRAYEAEKKAANLQQALSQSAIAAERNEYFIGLMATENEKLKGANARITARAASKEKDFDLEVEMLVQRAQLLEESLTAGFQAVETYSAFFQQNYDDWNELVNTLENYRRQENERATSLWKMTSEFNTTVENFHDECNELIRDLGARIDHRKDATLVDSDFGEDSQSDTGGEYHSSGGDDYRLLSQEISETDFETICDSAYESVPPEENRSDFGRTKSHSEAMDKSDTSLTSPIPPAPPIPETQGGLTLSQLDDSGDIMSFKSDSGAEECGSNSIPSQQVPSADDPLIRNSEDDEFVDTSMRLEHNVTTSLQALAGGASAARGRPRSLSVGDLPRSFTRSATALDQMPGSWPQEIVSHGDTISVSSFPSRDFASWALKVLTNIILPVVSRFLNIVNPANTIWIVYAALLYLGLWRAFKDQWELKQWERANEAYFAQRLRNQYASPPGWIETIGFEISKWLEFDRSSLG